MSSKFQLQRRFPDGSIGTLGFALKYRKGWKFYPSVSGRDPSRSTMPLSKRVFLSGSVIPTDAKVSK